MVHTPRTQPPPFQLVKYSKKWTARFLAALKSNPRRDWATTYAKQVPRTALREMAHGKCVFCESALEVTTYHAKGEHDHQGAVLKPDAEDPEPYFWIHPDTGKLEPHPNLDATQSRRANETIRLCDLQRPALCTQRTDMMSRVLAWLPGQAEAEWRALSDPRAEYKFVARHLLEIRGLKVLADYDRARFRGTST